MDHAFAPLPASALPESERRYRRLFENAMDGILVLDAESGVVVEANPFLTNLLGYAQEDLIGKALWDLEPFRSVAADREAFRKLQGTESARYENLPLETGSGEIVEVEFISNVFRVNGQRFIQCNIRDITEHHHAAAALRTANERLAHVVTSLRQRDTDLQLLHRISSLLQACNSRYEVCQVITRMAGDLFAGRDGFLALRKHGHSDLEPVAYWGTASIVAANFSPHDCWGIRRGQPHEVTDPGEDLACRHFSEPPRTGYICIPLTVQGDFLGLLCLVGTGAISAEQRAGQRNLVLTLAEAIKLSLFNLDLQERLRQQATRDPLTGLFNRRYLEDSLARELHLAWRQHGELGLALLDLDHFKRFNDTFGHDAGDLLLQQVGNVLTTELRQSDIACRYGGEEFVLVFPGSAPADTSRRVEEIRQKIRELSIRHDGRNLGRVTASAGLAWAPEHGRTAAALIAAADDALYAAKREGRDRLVCSEAGVSRGPEDPTEQERTP